MTKGALIACVIITAGAPALAQQTVRILTPTTDSCRAFTVAMVAADKTALTGLAGWVVSHDALMSEALAAGAIQVNGGQAQGVLMPATVIDKVTPAMRLFREESFGPIVAITRARDEAHAIELANDTEYGLAAAIFTRDLARGLKLARQIKSGICHINGPTVHDEAQMPFGGTKASGYGRFGGKAGIDQFRELRWITIDTEPGHYPI